MYILNNLNFFIVVFDLHRISVFPTLVMSVAYVESLIIPSSSSEVAVESALEDSVKLVANELDSVELESVESLSASAGSEDEATVEAAKSSSDEF